ncbi:TetR family transcriptional regulator [Dryocola sp. BD613]|uniref:TetR family transcriptional regulator n=1 Tax=Dryocola sp. BD613 TaxID=3133272 RepID=UPI003F5081D4
MEPHEISFPERFAEASLKEKIFFSALTLFAEFGLNGARMEQIAEKAGTTKRMVVYHFKSKEQLYVQVLEYVYTQIRTSERQLNLADLPPVEAMVRLVEWTFDFHDQHPDFIRIICMENMQRGRFVKESAFPREINRSALDLLEEVLSRGQAKQLFNAAITAKDVHRLIGSFSFYHVANSYTYSNLFEEGRDPAEHAEHYRRMAVKVVLRYIGP